MLATAPLSKAEPFFIAGKSLLNNLRLNITKTPYSVLNHSSALSCSATLSTQRCKLPTTATFQTLHQATKQFVESHRQHDSHTETKVSVENGNQRLTVRQLHRAEPALRTALNQGQVTHVPSSSIFSFLISKFDSTEQCGTKDQLNTFFLTLNSDHSVLVVRAEGEQCSLSELVVEASPVTAKLNDDFRQDGA